MSGSLRGWDSTVSQLADERPVVLRFVRGGVLRCCWLRSPANCRLDSTDTFFFGRPRLRAWTKNSTFVYSSGRTTVPTRTMWWCAPLRPISSSAARHNNSSGCQAADFEIAGNCGRALTPRERECKSRRWSGCLLTGGADQLLLVADVVEHAV